MLSLSVTYVFGIELKIRTLENSQKLFVFMMLSEFFLDILDVDLATLDDSKKFLRGCFKEQPVVIPGNSILQLQRMYNISVHPKERELPGKYHVGKDVLNVVLTDGDINVDALMYRAFSGFSLNTPPGTKIRIIEPITVTNGTFTLSAENFEALGGYVPNLIDKWILQRKCNGNMSLGHHMLNNEGPTLLKASGPKKELLPQNNSMEVTNIFTEQNEQPNWNYEPHRKMEGKAAFRWRRKQDKGRFWHYQQSRHYYWQWYGAPSKY